MNKRTSFLLSLIIFLVVPAVAFGIPGVIGSPAAVVAAIIAIIWPIFVGFSVIMFMVAGILFLAAQGEAGKIKDAKNALIWGVIGVVVGIVAFSLPLIIGNTLGTGI